MFQFFLDGGSRLFSRNIADQHQAEEYQGSSAPPGQWSGFVKYDEAYESLQRRRIFIKLAFYNNVIGIFNIPLRFFTIKLVLSKFKFKFKFKFHTHNFFKNKKLKYEKHSRDVIKKMYEKI